MRIANSDPIAGWLIPSLSAAIPGERNLILIDAPMEALPERYHAEYRTFGARLTALSPSKFTAAKMAVAEVRAGLWPRDQYRVAVHKMGPVPALRLSGDPVTAWHWPGRTFEIVVFPTGGATYEAANTTAALFECLTALNVTEVLRVYLEDIFEHLKDMSDRLNATQCVDRIKGIREIIGQSIKTKLHALTPSRQS